MSGFFCVFQDSHVIFIGKSSSRKDGVFWLRVEGLARHSRESLEAPWEGGIHV